MKKNWNWMIAGILGGVAALVYFISLADYAFPGLSAHLMVTWQGLDATAEMQYPLMAVFCKAFGGGNLIAPVCGVLSVMLIYAIVSFFVSKSCVSEQVALRARGLGRVAGVVAAVVFMLTPGVREAATHLEPRLFDACWVLIIFALMIPYLSSSLPGALFSVLIGALMALGYCDSAVFVAVAPLVLMEIVFVEWKRGSKPYLPLTLFTISFLVVFFASVKFFGIELTPFLKASSDELKGFYTTDGWLYVALFATLPFIVSLFSTVRTFGDRPGLVQWFFHGAMTFVAILSIATPLSPSSLLRSEGICPVLTSAYVAMVAGYLAAFWWVNRRQMLGAAVGVVFAFVLVFTLSWNLFTFDGQRGAFADVVARKILTDLGDRTWFVTGGILDDHLLLQAQAMKKELHLINLGRDSEDYLAHLGKVVKEKGVGGPKNEELALSLKLGVLPFIQEWLDVDPSVSKEIAIYGVPDLWYRAGFDSVPEFLFFGADTARTPDWSKWKEFDQILKAPKGWGSYHSPDGTDPVERMRFAIRRHVGFVATNRGFWLQDQHEDDEAFRFYELVLNEIDSDNFSALFNEAEMADKNFPKAVAKKSELDRRIKAIKEDKTISWAKVHLSTFYGYIRNAELFAIRGLLWAKSGIPGDALAQMRRAIDFAPADKRLSYLLIMANFYAADNKRAKSREIYQSILNENANDHDALIGMLRLKLMDGDQQGALEYLERAAKASPEGSRTAQVELAMVAMMKNDLEGAKKLLRKVTGDDAKDLQSWNLLASIILQQWDSEKEQATRDKLLSEVKDRILPEMERQAANPNDYYVQTTKAFLLMRQGESKRRDARDAFAAAARSKPNATLVQESVLSLDIMLVDADRAKRDAIDILSRNRNSPIANYVLGSLALQGGDLQESVIYLRRAVNTPQPTIMALNDLAEALRRLRRFAEAEKYIRKAIEIDASKMAYTLHQTLGEILLDSGERLDEAEASIRKAIELSKADKSDYEDVRLYATLARVQILRGDKNGAKSSIRRVKAKKDELSDFEKKEFEEIEKSVK